MNQRAYGSLHIEAVIESLAVGNTTPGELNRNYPSLRDAVLARRAEDLLARLPDVAVGELKAILGPVVSVQVLRTFLKARGLRGVR